MKRAAGRPVICSTNPFGSWVDSFEWLTALLLSTNAGFHIERPARFIEFCAAIQDRLGAAVVDSESRNAVGRVSKSIDIKQSDPETDTAM